MPIKRRTAKGRAIDELKVEELINGPGSCLLAGCGYYMPHNGPGAVPGEAGGFFWDISPAAQAIVLDRMQADWHRFGAAIMAMAEKEPWALRQFGFPGTHHDGGNSTGIEPSLGR